MNKQPVEFTGNSVQHPVNNEEAYWQCMLQCLSYVMSHGEDPIESVVVDWHVAAPFDQCNENEARTPFP